MAAHAQAPEPAELDGGPGGQKLTTKGERTRASLIEAAAEVFTAQGYFDTKLSDITDRAGVAIGSLYTYFPSREAILAAVIESSYRSVDELEDMTITPEDDPVAKIRHANRRYIESFQRNAGFHRLMAEAAAVDGDVRRERIARAQAFFHRNAASIRAFQDAGLVSAELDADLAARALSIMVSRTCFAEFVEADGAEYRTEADVEHLIDTLTRLWAGALGLL